MSKGAGASDPPISAEDATIEGSLIARRDTLMDEDLSGQVVGHYAITSRLGAGGMGVVYAAYDPRLDRRVALKLLHASDRAHPGSEGHARLLREAQALAQLQHPNVITIHDVGEHQGQVFIAMEFVDGITLAAWQDAEPRAWSSVLDVYLRAGEGIAAAHDQGLVHRDFKPENVMLTLEGQAVRRVQVLDFGLARATQERASSSDAAPEFDQLSSDITRAGRVMGTPAYMAPEQHLGGAVGPAADQFSLCVALYEALYGQRPFEWSTALELAAAVLDGKVREPPRGHPAPRHLWPVLRRGLMPTPTDRWPSARDLLHALRRDPSQARGRWLTAAGIVALAGGLYGAVAVLDAQRLADCRDEAATIETVWTPARRQSVREAMEANERPYASRAAAGTLPKLDDYAQAWRDARTRVCTVIGPDDDEQRACLDEHRAHFSELVTELERAGDQAIERATTAASSLPQLVDCEDTAVLRTLGVVASSAETRELRARLGHAHALMSLGRYADARDEAREIAREAEEAGDPRLEVRARSTLGEALARTGSPAEAERETEKAVHLAGASGLEALAAKAATKLAFRVGYTNARGEEASALLAVSEAWLDAAGVGERDLRRADILDTRGIIALRRADTEAARLDLEAARELRVMLLGEDHPVVLNSLTRLGAVAIQRDDYATALPALQRVEALRRQTLGEQHPIYASALANLAGATWFAGRREEAIEMLERSIATREASLGPRDPSLTTALGNLAHWQSLRGDYDEAIRNAEKAYEIVEATHGPDHVNTALALARVAQAHKDLDPRRAKEDLERALEIQLEQLGPRHDDIAVTRQNLGGALLRLRENVAATVQLGQALEIEASDDPTEFQGSLFLVMSTALVRAGDPLAAVPVLHRGIAKCNGGRCDRIVASMYTNLCYAHLIAGDGEAAAAAIQRSLAKREARGELPTTVARLNEGVAAALLGRTDQAEQIYEALLEECERGVDGNPEICRATRRWLGELQLDQGRAEEARALLEAARKIHTVGLASQALDIPAIDVLLARAMLATGGDEDEARALAEGARDWYASAGPGWGGEIERIEAWLREHASEK